MPITFRTLLALTAICSLVILHYAHAKTRLPQTPTDNAELLRMHNEDQADRSPADGKAIDWSTVAPRDKARLARTKELYHENQLTTANDYYHAALILQHGTVPEDFLLAHEFCVVAISKGKNDKHTRWLAAASEDRFLMNIGRPQRFGTQYLSAPGQRAVQIV
ncbi:MAG TPA: hypothetical protein VJV03_11375 [Pyrinomonadaceae bacterium]|nr:hypothetical protein [Pyrinomonadaceae bacterium]